MPTHQDKKLWSDDFEKRFTWEHSPEGRGYLYDNLGQQTVDEVIMKDFISHVESETRRRVIDEMLEWAESQKAILENCNNVDGRVQSICYENRNRAIDWNAIVERFIQVMKQNETRTTSYITRNK
jgi:hypothetical protein